MWWWKERIRFVRLQSQLAVNVYSIVNTTTTWCIPWLIILVYTKVTSVKFFVETVAWIRKNGLLKRFGAERKKISSVHTSVSYIWHSYVTFTCCNETQFDLLPSTARLILLDKQVDIFCWFLLSALEQEIVATGHRVRHDECSIERHR